MGSARKPAMVVGYTDRLGRTLRSLDSYNLNTLLGDDGSEGDGKAGVQNDAPLSSDMAHVLVKNTSSTDWKRLMTVKIPGTLAETLATSFMAPKLNASIPAADEDCQTAVLECDLPAGAYGLAAISGITAALASTVTSGQEYLVPDGSGYLKTAASGRIRLVANSGETMGEDLKTGCVVLLGGSASQAASSSSALPFTCTLDSAAGTVSVTGGRWYIGGTYNDVAATSFAVSNGYIAFGVTYDSSAASFTGAITKTSSRPTPSSSLFTLTLAHVSGGALYPLYPGGDVYVTGRWY